MSRPSGSPCITEIALERRVTPTTFTPGPTPNTVRAADGTILTAPDGWVLLPPGDAGLTRRVKAAGDHWVVQEKRGRKIFSRGIWAPAATIERIRAELEAERSTEGYARRQEAASRRREQAQAEYVEDFHGAVLAFLAFHSSHADLADRLARAVTEHATPVGSGTVARTKRIPVEQRAEAAVIAWMRHQTTGYDNMVIPGSRGSGERSGGCWPGDPRSCWTAIGVGSRSQKVARSGRRWRPNRLPDESTRELGEIAVAEEEKLKLGKGAAFVKSRLKRRLPAGRDLGGRLPGAAQADRPEHDAVSGDGRHGGGRLAPVRVARPRQALGQRPRHDPGECHAATAGGEGSSAHARPSAGAPPVAGVVPGPEGTGRGGVGGAGTPRHRAGIPGLTSGGSGTSTGSGWSSRSPSRRRSRRCSRPSPGTSMATGTSRSATRRASGSSSGRCDDGGLAFEDDRPDTLAEALAALEVGLTRWFEEEDVEPD